MPDVLHAAFPAHLLENGHIPAFKYVYFLDGFGSDFRRPFRWIKPHRILDWYLPIWTFENGRFNYRWHHAVVGDNHQDGMIAVNPVELPAQMAHFLNESVAVVDFKDARAWLENYFDLIFKTFRFKSTFSFGRVESACSNFCANIHFEIHDTQRPKKRFGSVLCGATGEHSPVLFGNCIDFENRVILFYPIMDFLDMLYEIRYLGWGAFHVDFFESLPSVFFQTTCVFAKNGLIGYYNYLPEAAKLRILNFIVENPSEDLLFLFRDTHLIPAIHFAVDDLFVFSILHAALSVYAVKLAMGGHSILLAAGRGDFATRRDVQADLNVITSYLQIYERDFLMSSDDFIVRWGRVLGVDETVARTILHMPGTPENRMWLHLLLGSRE